MHPAVSTSTPHVLPSHQAAWLLSVHPHAHVPAIPQVGVSIVHVGVSAAQDLLAYFKDPNKVRVSALCLSPPT